VTLEENAVIGGAGAEVARSLDGLATHPRVLRLGLPDHFIDHGDSGTAAGATRARRQDGIARTRSTAAILE
jgi:1-deoxy-D-xylulose-5-phosphate synthase